MKNCFPLLVLFVLAFTSCKDTSAPSFVSFKINGRDLNQIPDSTFRAGINDTAYIDMIFADDEALTQFIAFIDTTGLDDKERLFAASLTGKEDFVRMIYTMREIDSLSNQYFFGNLVPVNFTVLDDNTNSTSTTVKFRAQ